MENGAAASLVDHQQELWTAACPVPRPGPSTGHAWSSWVLFLCQHCPAAPSSQDAFVTAMISPDLATCVSPQPCLQDVSHCLPHGKNREIIITSGPTAPWAQAAQQGARPLGQCPSFSWGSPLAAMSPRMGRGLFASCQAKDRPCLAVVTGRQDQGHRRLLSRPHVIWPLGIPTQPHSQ